MIDKIQYRYRLELKWGSVEKPRDNVCFLSGAYFCGPVLKNAKEIKGGDSIKIDFTPQYSNIISNYYFVDLKWGDVKYKNDNVFLYDCFMLGEYVNAVSNLDISDYVVIDTSKHEEKVHYLNLVYQGYVVNKGGVVYGN